MNGEGIIGMIVTTAIGFYFLRLIARSEKKKRFGLSYNDFVNRYRIDETKSGWPSRMARRSISDPAPETCLSAV